MNMKTGSSSSQETAEFEEYPDNFPDDREKPAVGVRHHEVTAARDPQPGSIAKASPPHAGARGGREHEGTSTA
jgi:hypothetical protein